MLQMVHQTSLRKMCCRFKFDAHGHNNLQRVLSLPGNVIVSDDNILRSSDCVYPDFLPNKFCKDGPRFTTDKLRPFTLTLFFQKDDNHGSIWTVQHTIDI
jgi:hypothetical protein